MNFFALRGARESATLLAFTLDKPSQAQLGQLLQPLAERIAASDRVRFDPGYSASAGEIVEISPYQLPAAFAVLADPSAVAGIPPLREEHVTQGGIRGLVAAEWTGNRLQFLAFQRLDAHFLLKPEAWRLMFAGGRFVRDDRAGVEVSDRVDGLFLDGSLLVESWSRTHAMLDLSAWMREATLSEAQEFVTNTRFTRETGFDLGVVSDSWTRRKIASISASGVLHRCKPAVLRAYAAKFELSLELSKGKIILPADKKRFKEVLSLLDEDYLAFEPTGERWVVNSKRRATQ